MGLLYHGLLAPATGPLNGLLWLARTLRDRAEGELYDEDGLRAALTDLELHYESGEIGEDAYEAAERDLLERLKISRQRMRERLNGD